MIISHYIALMSGFVEGDIPVEQFVKRFIAAFKEEDSIPQEYFDVLDSVFADADSYSADVELRAENPEFYIDEDQLRESVRAARENLSQKDGRK